MLLENNKILLNGCVLSAPFSGEEEGGQIDKKERISSFFFEESSILRLRMKLIQEKDRTLQMGTHKSPFQGNKFKTRTLIRSQPQNVNLQRTRYKIRSKRALTGGPWRGTRPSSCPPTLRTTRSTKATNTNQNTITAPARSKRETTENRAYREETLQVRDLDGRRPGWRMDGTVRRSPPVRRERGTARSSGSGG